MNITDKGSIFIVSLFYIITLASGYMIHENQMIGQKNEVERLIITIHNNEINTENNSTIVYEDVGRPQPIQKIYAAASVVAISSIYEQKGYELDHITEFLKKVVDQEVVITRIWFSKKNWVGYFLKNIIVYTAIVFLIFLAYKAIKDMKK